MALKVIQGLEEAQQNIHYEVDIDSEPIGVGGMGAVFKGIRVEEKTNVRTEVAIKFLFADLKEEVIERARREASIRIHHENLVEMLGFITVEEEVAQGKVLPRYHVVSELLRGVMLHDLLNGKVTDQYGNEIPFARELNALYQNDRYGFATKVTKSILSGLMTLHDNGYIHRDLDPSNIMVTWDGKIKIIDFGISKQLTTLTTQDKQLTTAGNFMGKASYAAPELVLGDVAHQNETTDIYAVAVMLFQFITGRLPFEGSTHEVLEMQLHDKMPMSLVSDCNMRKIIAKATNKKQALRYQSAAEFRVSIEKYKPDTSKLCEIFNKPGILKTIVLSGSAVAAIIVCVLIINSVLTGNKEKKAEEQRRLVAERIESLKNVLVDSYDENIFETDSLTQFKIVSVAAKILEAKNLLLTDSIKAETGLMILEDLAGRDYKASSQAAYILSRLYAENAQRDSSVIKMKANIDGFTDFSNVRAHEMNLRAEVLDSTYYKATYELACDYYAGEIRTGKEDSRDLNMALTYFERGRRHAEAANDSTYLEKFMARIEELKQ